MNEFPLDCVETGRSYLLTCLSTCIRIQELSPNKTVSWLFFETSNKKFSFIQFRVYVLMYFRLHRDISTFCPQVINEYFEAGSTILLTNSLHGIINAYKITFSRRKCFPIIKIVLKFIQSMALLIIPTVVCQIEVIM